MSAGGPAGELHARERPGVLARVAFRARGVVPFLGPPGRRPSPQEAATAQVVPVARASTSALAAEYRTVLEQRLAHLVQVDQPLVLITQPGRSGGTLLMRLFDAHPECHVVPHELGRMFGGMGADLGDAQKAWTALTPSQQLARFGRGFRQPKARQHGDESRYPFLLPPGLQRAIFEARLEELEQPSGRDALDAYFTSYFNALLDNVNLRSGPKRWVVGFEPGALTQSTGRRGAHRAVYPDGRTISILRDPWSWYRSASRFSPRRFADVRVAVDYWREGTEAVLAALEEDPDGVRLVSFADLLGQTEATMRVLAAWLGIEFTPSLLEPTFNGVPIRANSSFANAPTTPSRKPVKRSRKKLSAEDDAYIEACAGGLYRRASESVLAPTPAPVGGSR